MVFPEIARLVQEVTHGNVLRRGGRPITQNCATISLTFPAVFGLLFIVAERVPYEKGGVSACPKTNNRTVLVLR